MGIIAGGIFLVSIVIFVFFQFGVVQNFLYAIVALVKLNDKEIISGSEDATIRIWNIATGKCKAFYMKMLVLNG